MRDRADLIVVAGVLALAGWLTGCSMSGSLPSGAEAPFGVCGPFDATTGDALAEVCEGGRLRVVTDLPTGSNLWFDEGSRRWEGYAADVATEIATRLGVTADFTHRDEATVTGGSWDHRWDLSLGSMMDTPRYDERFTFSPPYVYTPTGVAVNVANTSVQDLDADLDGTTVCVAASTPSEAYLDRSLVLGTDAPSFQYVIDDPTIVPFGSETEALKNLAEGDGVTCDAALAAVPTIEQFMTDGGGVKIVGSPLFNEPMRIAFDKNDPTDSGALAQVVSEIVDNMHADGTLSALSVKWYGADLTTASTSAESRSPS